jgi:hypothetical protein
MKAAPTHLPGVTAEDEAARAHAPNCAREVMRHADDSAAYLSEPCTCGATAFATARIGTARYVLEEVQCELRGGTVVARVYFRGVEVPLVLRVARGKARLFANALGLVLAE